MLKGSLEDNVLTMLAHSTEHAAMLTITVTSDLFSTRAYRKIAEKTITFIQTYNEPPGVHLRDILEDDLRRGEDGRLLARVHRHLGQVRDREHLVTVKSSRSNRHL